MLINNWNNKTLKSFQIMLKIMWQNVTYIAYDKLRKGGCANLGGQSYKTVVNMIVKNKSLKLPILSEKQSKITE